MSEAAPLVPSARGASAREAYPPAPWHMHGSLWVSIFRCAGSSRHPAGVYGAAFVRYEAPSPLTYWELLVARPADSRGQVTITDIWVDSPASMRGGRELWAIPKDLADFAVDVRDSGPLGKVTVSASSQGRRLATATFRDLSALAPRTPFRGGTHQRHAPGEDVHAPLAGRARTLPALGSWDFAPDGPLAFLRGARRLGTARMRDFEMSFG